MNQAQPALPLAPAATDSAAFTDSMTTTFTNVTEITTPLLRTDDALWCERQWCSAASNQMNDFINWNWVVDGGVAGCHQISVTVWCFVTDQWFCDWWFCNQSHFLKKLFNQHIYVSNHLFTTIKLSSSSWFCDVLWIIISIMKAADLHYNAELQIIICIIHQSALISHCIQAHLCNKH